MLVVCCVEDMAEDVTWGLDQEPSLLMSEWSTEGEVLRSLRAKIIRSSLL